jgi:hypothetical protein
MYYGEEILVRTMSATAITDATGKTWQYHSRSDAHSKVACWAILFDLLLNCELLQRHVQGSKVGFGINHTMHDWSQNRDKDLDLVICTPQNSKYSDISFSSLAETYQIQLTPNERNILDSFPPLFRCEVGTSLIAVEAKACMTEHVKARPRLYDELTSSHQTIHGDTKNSIAVGFIAINTASNFVSPGRNVHIADGGAMLVSEHKQPYATKQVYEKMEQLGRRTRIEDAGFDAIGITLMTCRNNGSQIELDRDIYNVLRIDNTFSYGKMIERVKSFYSSAFAQI